MTSFPRHLWLLAISRTIRWLVDYEPPKIHAKIEFGQPRLMEPRHNPDA